MGGQAVSGLKIRILLGCSPTIYCVRASKEILWRGQVPNFGAVERGSVERPKVAIGELAENTGEQLKETFVFR